ncbi:PKD domain-containing protein [Marinilabilia salmonicolor]|uniref:PKD domain-containing protein n=1 Tax=Marinilabilia salmonicolor TaxID=989 RepID=UPI00029AFAF6|nr:PKD domain-containing protein [Marinilabilia salmonicolor]
MPNTRGFEVVAELHITALREILQSAWDNGGSGSEGTIPSEIPIPADIVDFADPFEVTGGQISIHRDGLDLELIPAQNRIRVLMDTFTQIEFKNSEDVVDPLIMLEMDAAIGISTPIGNILGSDVNIGLLYESLTAADITVDIPNNPVDAIFEELAREYVHILYEEEAIPHLTQLEGQSWSGINFDCDIMLFDDETDSSNRISLSYSAGDSTFSIEIPAYIRITNLSLGASPMGVNTKINIVCPFVHNEENILLNFSSASVSSGTITAGDGTEGIYYEANKSAASAMGIDLDGLFHAQISAQGTALINNLGNRSVSVPSVNTIASVIKGQVLETLHARRYNSLWTPDTPEGSPVEIDSAEPKVVTDALAIAVNPMNGTNINSLNNFIPTDNDLGIALNGDYVCDLIQEIVDSPRDEGGFGGIPSDLGNIEGHNTDLNSLSWELKDGAIHFSGTVKVHDVFCGADADVDFWVDIGLRWTPPDSDGQQVLEPYIIDQESDMPWWAWLLAALGFILGLITGVIAIVIAAVINNLVESIGLQVMEDEVSGKLQTLGAWPQQLQGIGTVESFFDEEVIIDEESILFTGSVTITATYKSALRYKANTGGPYNVPAIDPVMFYAGAYNPQAQFNWKIANAFDYSGNEIYHSFEDDGIYLAKVEVVVTQTGGATTNNSVKVKVLNRKPVVDVGADLVCYEGEELKIIASFTDIEWKDTHKAYWNFGDNSPLEIGELTETNNKPQAEGTVIGKHRYCNNGIYTITLLVIDDNGGVGKDSLSFKVNNVAPKVKIYKHVYAYKCSPITLVAYFTDPGWCDTHIAKWNFGDGTPTIPATIKEVHASPMGYGIAAATNTYKCFGKFFAVCCVTDSDLATTEASTIVEVIDLINKNFEEGFRTNDAGVVANGWNAFYHSLDAKRPLINTASGNAQFAPEEFIVHEGQRSQVVRLTEQGAAGIFQNLGTNIGWDYQVIIWYHLSETDKGARCMLGIDPYGNEDPLSTNIVWNERYDRFNWYCITCRVTALANEISIFIKLVNTSKVAKVYIDDVRFSPYPCPLKLNKPIIEPEPEPTQLCVDWADEQTEREVGIEYSKNNFDFSSIDPQQPLKIVFWGQPVGTGKLWFSNKGVQVKLPYASFKVEVTYVLNTKSILYLYGYNQDDDLIVEARNEYLIAPETTTLEGDGITYLKLFGGLNEAMIIKICIYYNASQPIKKQII